MIPSGITESQYEKIVSTARRLNIPDPEWLRKLIRFESRYNPLAKNPGSTARGLIQVTDKTARDVFGVRDSLTLINKYPDFNSQMDHVVYPYLKRFGGFPTAQSLYMAVFFPAARNVEPNTTFLSLYQKLFRDWSEKYAQFEKANKGIRTVQDYINYVEGTFTPKKGVSAGIAILAGLGGAYLLRRCL